MNALIYWTACVLIVLLQALPLTWVAQLVRAGGALAYWLDVRHRRVALRNLTMVFGHETFAREIRRRSGRHPPLIHDLLHELSGPLAELAW